MFVLILCVLITCVTKHCCVSKNTTNASVLDFHDVVHSKYFIDKTYLIAHLVVNNNACVVLTAPRRFGKSTVIRMLEQFFHVVVDEDGEPMFVNVTRNEKLFANNNLQILEEEELFTDYIVKYPVVVLDFFKFQSVKFSVFKKEFQAFVKEVYSRFAYLVRSEVLNKRERAVFLKYLKSEEGELTQSNLLSSIRILCKILAVHFVEPCIILVDEMDYLILKSVHQPFSDLEEIAAFLKSFFNETLVIHENVHKVFGYGTSFITGWLMPEVNATLQPYMTQRSSSFCGFSDEEMELVFDKYNLTDEEDEFRDWYLYDSIYGEVFSVESVLRFLETRVFDNYFVQPRLIGNIEELLSFDYVRESIEMMLHEYTQGVGKYPVGYKYEVTISDIVTLKRLLTSNRYDVTKDEADMILQYLSDLGYIGRYKLRSTYAFMVIPNRQAKVEIEKHMGHLYYQQKFKNGFKQFLALPSLFMKLNKTVPQFDEIFKCLRQIYQEKVPQSDSELQRDFFYTLNFSRIFKSVKRGFDNASTFTVSFRGDEAATLVGVTVGPATAYEALVGMLDITQIDYFSSDLFIGLYLGKQNMSVSYIVNGIDTTKSVNITSIT